MAQRELIEYLYEATENGRGAAPAAGLSSGAMECNVIGVVRTAKYFYLGEPPRPFLYLPFSQNYASRMIVHVEGGSIPEVLAEIRRQDPALAVSEARMLADPVDRTHHFIKSAQ